MTTTPTAARPVIRIASRASQLALWQARHVTDLIQTAQPGVTVEIVEVSTTGDRDRFSALSQMGGQGVFTREVQAAVLDGRADLAVHSLKDLPTEPTAGLVLGAVPDRAPVYDAIILPAAMAAQTAEGSEVLRQLPREARIGTGSLRRQAQLLHYRSDFKLLENRGNVETRLKKLDAGEFDAIILAEAGLRRLGYADRISGLLCPPLMLPAVGQGALGIECRADDEFVIEVLRLITNSSVLAAVTAERTLLSVLRAGCHAPLGVWTQADGVQLKLDAVVLSTDGKERLTATVVGPTADPRAIGVEAAEKLRAQGAERLLAKM